MIRCPWCEKGELEPTPKEYNDPKEIVYCPECSSVFRLSNVPELSPCGMEEPMTDEEVKNSRFVGPEDV